MNSKFYYISVFGIKELELWSKVLFNHGYSYRIECENIDNELVYGLQVRVTDNCSFERLKSEKNGIFKTELI